MSSQELCRGLHSEGKQCDCGLTRGELEDYFKGNIVGNIYPECSHLCGLHPSAPPTTSSADFEEIVRKTLEVRDSMSQSSSKTPRTRQIHLRNQALNRDKQCVVTGTSNPELLHCSHIISDPQYLTEYNLDKDDLRNVIMLTKELHNSWDNDLGFSIDKDFRFHTKCSRWKNFDGKIIKTPLEHLYRPLPQYFHLRELRDQNLINTCQLPRCSYCYKPRADLELHSRKSCPKQYIVEPISKKKKKTSSIFQKNIEHSEAIFFYAGASLRLLQKDLECVVRYINSGLQELTGIMSPSQIPNTTQKHTSNDFSSMFRTNSR